MNARSLFVVLLIFIACSAAWIILGGSITSRTHDAQRLLGADVRQMFGPAILQAAPTVAVGPAAGPEPAPGRPPDASRIQVTLDHEHRYRGLIWFSVYRVEFDATYTIRPTPAEAAAGAARFRMDLPPEANVDALKATAGERRLEILDGAIVGDLELGGGQPAEVRVRYASAGQDGWRYLPSTRGLRDFELTVRTNFRDIDYPADGLSPTQRAAPSAGGGVTASWRYERMLAARNRAIGVLTPAMPASGALAARIATFAPVSLFFFLVLMITIQVLRGLRLHPLNYLLIAAGFFAFHVLLAYLVDHVTIHLAFWIAASASVFLVVSYLRLVLGAKAAIRYAGAAQMVYLVFFSYAFFWRGWTGLTIVIGAVLTLFLVMQLTARLDWTRVLAARTQPARKPEPAAS